RSVAQPREGSGRRIALRESGRQIVSGEIASDEVSAIPNRPFVHSVAEKVLSVEGVSLKQLARKYGTPLYVYSAGHILQRFSLFRQSFSAVPHVVCYAVK